MLFAGDVLLFLPSGVLMLAGFLLRPHLEQSKRSTRLGTHSTSCCWFYGGSTSTPILVTCWQYVSPNEDLYNRNYDRLYLFEILIVVSVLFHLIRQSDGPWRRFYLLTLARSCLTMSGSRSRTKPSSSPPISLGAGMTSLMSRPSHYSSW